MKKTLTAIVAASALAAAGLAQADAIYYPDGSVVELGDSSVETLALDDSSTVDTTVLGASADPSLDSSTTIDTTVMGAPAASTSTTTTVQVPQLVYVQPNIDFDRATVLSQMHNRKLLIRDHRVVSADTRETFNVPQRAGEASTMTSGAPNLVTDNSSIVVGGLTIPHTVVTVDQPYYVMSF